jgi:hypothetical protein
MQENIENKVSIEETKKDLPETVKKMDSPKKVNFNQHNTRPSVEITPENHALLKKVSSQRGKSMSAIINDLIRDYGIADKEKKVILSVPTSLVKNNKEGLREWLKIRMYTIMSAFYPEKRI